MITAEAFLAIESALSARLSQALKRATKAVYAKVEEALSVGDLNRAAEIVNGLNLGNLLEQDKGFVDYMTNTAMLFGASRVTSQPGTSVVGMGFETLTAFQMVSSFEQSVVHKAELHLKTVALTRIASMREKVQKYGNGNNQWAKPYPIKGEETSITAALAVRQIDFEVKDPEDAEDSLNEVKKEAHAGFDSYYKAWYNSLGTAEKEAVERYIDSDFHAINKALRDKVVLGTEVPDHLAEVSNTLQGALTKAPPLPQDVKVYRGVSKSFMTLVEGGGIISDSAFLSTSIHPDVAKRFSYKGGDVLEINVPKGTKAGYLSVGWLSEEGELLLPPGTKVRVTPEFREGVIGVDSGGVPKKGRIFKAEVVTAKAEKVFVITTGSTKFGWDGEDCGLAVAKAAPSVLQPFSSFMDDAGEAFMNIAASLHTSRVASYGFTAEASVLGLEEYQISEQLDPRTCPICRQMHGKKFRVEDARNFLNVVVRTTEPSDLKQLQPWPSQSKDSVAALKDMSAADMVARGWHVPPFHPRCRGLLTRVGRVPPLDDITEGKVAEKYLATPQDFKALRMTVAEEKIKVWNDTVGLPPAEVISRLTGMPLDEFLLGLGAAENPKAYTGLRGITINPDGRVVIKITKEGFGSSNTFDQTVKIKKDSLYLEAVDLHEDDQGAGVVKKFMREFYTLAKDMNKSSMSLLAGLDMGGYAWAKYGFKPTAAGWAELKKDVAKRFADKKMVESLKPAEYKAYEAIMASKDGSSIYSLSDMGFGKALLRGQLWGGELYLNDAEAVTRFLTYIGEL